MRIDERVTSTQRDHWADILHAAAVALAALAVVESVVTYATPQPTRPRIVAFVLAGLSAAAVGLGIRRFRWMGRVDAIVALAADLWVWLEGGW